MSGYDPFAPVPEKSVVATWIENLRANRKARETRKIVREENRKRWERFARFEFGGEFLSCENTIAGRWFIRFGEDGVIESAVPADQRFAMDYVNPDFPVIDLGEIFQLSTTYHRVDVRTMEFSNASGTWRFAISPRLEDVDSVMDFSGVEHCCDQIRFEDLDRPGFRFELWRDESNPSKFEFHKEQGSR